MPPSRPLTVKVKMPRTMKLRWPRVEKAGEALEVVLHEGEAGAVDDADGAECDQQGSDVAGLLRKDAEGETKDGVEAELAGEHHDGGGGGLGDGVDQPAVEREDRNLDGKGDQEGERAKPEGVRPARYAVGGGEGGQVGQLEGAGLDVEPKHADEQERGGDEGVEEVLDGGAATVLGAAEGGDEDGHRHQGELPEGVVEEEVERDKDAEHGDLLQQEEGVEESCGDRRWRSRRRGRRGGRESRRGRRATWRGRRRRGGSGFRGFGIQRMSCTKRNVCCDPKVLLTSVVLKLAGRCRVSRKVMRVTTSAAAGCSLPRSGSSASRSAPTSGVKTMSERIEWSKECMGYLAPF